MALDSTVAGASADSYLSVADADAMAAGDLAADPEVALWVHASTTTAQKEQALRQATIHVEDAVESGWTAFAPAAQASSGLTFPRSIDHTLSGSTQVPFIPRGVRRATYLQAKYLLKNARELAMARTRQAQDLGSASEEGHAYTRSADAGASELTPAASACLAPFVRTEAPRGLGSVRMDTRIPGAGL